MEENFEKTSIFFGKCDLRLSANESTFFEFSQCLLQKMGCLMKLLT